MKEKRRDSKGRIMDTGESQRTDGKYLYKYVDAFGNTKYVYAWRLTPTDPTPKGKREKPSLRELEQQIRRDIEDGIDSTGKKMTLCQLYAKQNEQRAKVKKSTMKQREQLMRNAHSLASEGFIVSMLLAPNLSSFNNRISCSRCFCVLFFTFALCAFCLA